MSQTTVTRLKELLFDKEARDLDALSRRVEDLAADTSLQTADLARRVEHLHGRSGGDDQLRASVARVIDGALRDAEVERHRDLADAMAPVVIRSVRAELGAPHTQDQIAGTLYPKMGEMVSRYVASAMRDLMESINRRLESGLTNNRLMLKLRSLTSGRSMAELALADTQQLEVMEIYLIRRGSGELVHHWERGGDAKAAPTSGDNRDTLVSGFLTAITAFAEEAFESEKASLRSLDLDEHRIYLRGSPAHLLAAKCRGTAAGPIESLLDGELLRVLGEHQRVETAHAGDPRAREFARVDHQNLLGDLAERLESEIAARTRTAQDSGGGLRPLKILAVVIGLPLLALGLWQAFNRYQTWTVQAAADAIIQRMPELKGYPVTARAEDAGRSLWVVGLTPSADVRGRLTRELQLIRPELRITDTLGVLPQADVGAALRTESLRAAQSRVEKRLQALSAELKSSAAREQGPAAAALVAAEATVQRSAETVGKLSPDLTDRELQAAATAALNNLTAAHAQLAALAGGPSNLSGAASDAETLTGILDRIAALAEGIGRLAMTVEQTQRAERERARAIAPLAAEIEELKRRLAAVPLPPQPTARERLAGWSRQNAIFFSNGLEYRNEPAVQAQFAELVDLIKATSGIVRVVGYTDDAGTPARNAGLSLQRAERVVDDLVARGVVRSRLVAVGRGTALELGARSGAASPSRRVEIEPGFVGEEASSP